MSAQLRVANADTQRLMHCRCCVHAGLAYKVTLQGLSKQWMSFADERQMQKRQQD